MLRPLEIPPGVVRIGTDMESSGRWRDTSLVRWRDGSLRPVGGWRSFGDTTLNAAPRGALAWVSNSGDRWHLFGTYSKLYAVNSGGTTTDITPVGFTAGTLSAAENTGFGGGLYGAGSFGTPRPETGSYQECGTWSMATWGQYALACAPSDGKIYEWQLDTGTLPAAVTNAPTSCSGVLVTDERFVMALGAGGDPRKVQWCDKEANTTWTPSATNEAGDFSLETPGELMCGLSMRGRTLLLTDADAWLANYLGPPLVYGFDRAGDNCGAASRNAAVAAGDFAFWMGKNAFYVLNGGFVEELPCAVADFVFANMNRNQISKVYGVVNGAHSEVWWFFPSAGSVECDKYVAYDYGEKHWMIGTIDRTCGVDANPIRYPVWADASGNLHQHEVGNMHGSDSVYAETGPLSLGDEVFSATRLIPDEQTQGDVTVTFKTRLYPNAAESDHGPYTTGNPTSVRFTGRQVRMRAEAANDVDWRFGIQRLDARPRGQR